MTTMPAQKPGTSRQDYETPPEFVTAVENLLDIEFFYVDLAADRFNAKGALFLTKPDNSLAHDWGEFKGKGWCWLNPPFQHIAPWAEKCAIYGRSQIKIALLVPASVGSNWYKDFVKNEAFVFELNGRLSFDRKGPYPKDCLLALYGTPFRGSAVWDWRKTAIHGAQLVAQRERVNA